jgi:hypothetical protein
LIISFAHLLGQALDYSKDIDDFIGHHCNLQALELDADDWEAISQVAEWLKAFCSVTTQMSKMKEPMLSTVYAIFCDLQEHVASLLHKLPDTAPSELRDRLVEAHTKLSDYYFHSDESPYYTWAACEYKFLTSSHLHEFGHILDQPSPTDPFMHMHIDSVSHFFTVLI